MAVDPTDSASGTSHLSQGSAEPLIDKHEFSVSKSVIIGLKSFDELIARLEETKQPATHTWSVPLDVWEDELGRLRVWVANIGAHQNGQSSLDFRLRDASHIRQQIIELLQDLRKTIKDAEDIVDDQESYDLNPETGTRSAGEELGTELQQLHANAMTIINCLFQMSLLVRKPARHDLLTKEQPSDISAFEPFDIDHVRNRYPKAEEDLVQRLGLAMTQRRKRLKYRERHHAKLSQGLDIAQGKDDQETVTMLSETVATDFRPWEADIEDKSAKSDFAQTSYASTLLSGGDITIPSPPKDAIGGAPFECPYCYFLITAKDSRSWHQHIFLDLQPYICTVISCNTPHKLYSTRHDWARHLKTAHPEEWGGSRQAGPKSVMTRSRAQDPSGTCPLCLSKFEYNLLERDVARHLQELALFILPRIGDDSDVEDHDETDGLSYHDDNRNGSTNYGADVAPVSDIYIGSEGFEGYHPPLIPPTVAQYQQSRPVQDENPEGYEGGAKPIHPHVGEIGRIDALDPPSKEHPIPSPPLWLRQALSNLQKKYPYDLWEPVMRYTAVSTISDLPVSIPYGPTPSNTKFMYYPRIKCLDCPGKFYTPGPEREVSNFEVHCRHKLHRKKVEQRLTSSGVGG